MTITEAQRAGNNASFKRRYDQKAQIAAKRQWVLESEYTPEQLIELRDQRLRETAAREAARQGRAA